jgi:hypothetical protein
LRHFAGEKVKMRHLPCNTPACRSLGAMLSKSPAYPNGEPYIAGQYVSNYNCARCGAFVKLSPAQYNGLPELSLSDFERLATQYGNKTLKELPTRDLVGIGLKPKHAADLFGVGIQTAEDVAELEREQ